MKRYQLAKIVGWANRLQTRKRLQKVIFMLQAAGCPLEAEFTLHNYGPYSAEVARLSDEMVRADLLKEESLENSLGQQYSYQLTDHALQQLDALEANEQGQQWAAELLPFEALAKELLRADLKELEYASTILYFKKQGHDWPDAVDKACRFKGTDTVRSALGLAQKVVS